MYYKDENGCVFLKVEKAKITEVKLYAFAFGIMILKNGFRSIPEDYIQSTEEEFNKAFRQALKKII
ncbi:MAG: hypothetical protein JNM71_12695 [Flavobacterium lindanitolerans]|uniref:hypothetical protein n=1 Tax=Flavobacterium lindanitolerans TaxID=428988 RepID=UPI001A3E1D13|nr:hypothetical protein [Flavobacterium lindanitolerans]MBL7868865.1 hypothetical protein [Flavobacterium lindanitolerans]